MKHFVWLRKLTEKGLPSWKLVICGSSVEAVTSMCTPPQATSKKYGIIYILLTIDVP